MIRAKALSPGFRRIVGVVKRSEDYNCRIRPILEEEQRGKDCAVNIFRRKCVSDVLVMEPADTLPDYGTVSNLISPFRVNSE